MKIDTNKCYYYQVAKTLFKQDHITQQYSCKLTGLYQKTYPKKKKKRIYSIYSTCISPPAAAEIAKAVAKLNFLHLSVYPISYSRNRENSSYKEK